MLLGQSRNNLDSKGRIFVPVKWRPDTSDHVVVLIGLNPADVKRKKDSFRFFGTKSLLNLQRI